MARRIPRWLARAPVRLYWHGFGWLLSRRIMMLEHRGRRTGRRRYVVLEVLDRAPNVMILASGYGPESDWFRNICADPRVRVWSGRVRNAPARTTVLSEAETRARLHSYRLRNRRAAVALGRVLGIAELTSTDPLPDDIAERLPLVQVEVMRQR